MILLNYKNNFIKYIIYMSAVFISLFVIVNVCSKYEQKKDENVISSYITYTDELTEINVSYPRFKEDKINKIVSENIYSYVKDFKSYDKLNKSLNIDYDLYYFDNYLNIVYNIENSLTKIKNKNILIDLKNKKLAYISNLYDKDYLTDEINNIVYSKYSNNIYEKIKASNIDNHTYIIDNNKIDIYFNDILDKDINYVPKITIKLSESVIDLEEDKDNIETYDKKYIAFTFDDGPSKYTEELLRTFELNNSSATFFMLGNRMKYNEDIVRSVYNSNSEIGTHTYSHKRLTELSEDELYNEVNSSQIVYNNITKDNIKYLRPPYGSYNDKIKKLGYNIVLWNIDTKDWLVKDSKKIYNSVINNACDGCIVLMHDIYPETIEAVKMLIPALNEMNYEVVSISNLISNKNYNLSDNEAISHINNK